LIPWRLVNWNLGCWLVHVALFPRRMNNTNSYTNMDSNWSELRVSIFWSMSPVWNDVLESIVTHFKWKTVIRCKFYNLLYFTSFMYTICYILRVLCIQSVIFYEFYVYNLIYFTSFMYTICYILRVLCIQSFIFYGFYVYNLLYFLIVDKLLKFELRVSIFWSMSPVWNDVLESIVTHFKWKTVIRCKF
jgi:hypothetical protein